MKCKHLEFYAPIIELPDTQHAAYRYTCTMCDEWVVLSELEISLGVLQPDEMARIKIDTRNETK